MSREGKLNLTGIYDTISTPGFPATHPSLVFAFRARLTEEDSDKSCEVSLSLVNLENDETIWDASFQIDPQTIPEGEIRHIHHILEMRSVQFSGPGRYAFRIAAEGDRRTSEAVFKVVKAS